MKKILGSTTDFPTWGSGNGTENLQGIRLWKTEGLDYRTSTRLGKQTLGGHKQNLGCSRSQEKRAVSPYVTELEFPVRIQESLVEAWVNTLASGQTIGREHSLPHQQKIGFKITEKSCLQRKATLAPGSVMGRGCTPYPHPASPGGSPRLRHSWPGIRGTRRSGSPREDLLGAPNHWDTLWRSPDGLLCCKF